MPYIIDVPETVIRTVEQEQDVNVYNMEKLTIIPDINNPTNTQVICKISKGYMDGDTYILVAHMAPILLAGNPILASFAELADSEESRYENMKQAVWSVLYSENHIPQGTIS